MKNVLAALTLIAAGCLPALARQNRSLDQLVAASGKDLPTVPQARGSDKGSKGGSGSGKHPCSAHLDTGVMVARSGRAPTAAEVSEVVRRACAGVGKCRADAAFHEVEGETLGRLGLAGRSEDSIVFFNTLQHAIEGHDSLHRASRTVAASGGWWSGRDWDPETTLGGLAVNLSVPR